MNGSKPDKPGGSRGERAANGTHAPDELEERRRRLEAELAERRGEDAGSSGDRPGRTAGYAEALKLSSEFIGGVIVGAAFGWVFDRLLGTSPWGLIVFLLLGFCAGILNVLRSAGLMSQGFGYRSRGDRDGNEG